MQSEPKQENPYEMFYMNPKDEPDIHAFEEEQASAFHQAQPVEENDVCVYAQDTETWD